MFTGSNDLYTSTDPVVVMMKEITQVMEQLNYTINFFLYTLCSSMFWKEVLAIVMCYGAGGGSRGDVRWGDVRKKYIKSGDDAAKANP